MMTHKWSCCLSVYLSATIFMQPISTWVYHKHLFVFVFLCVFSLWLYVWEGGGHQFACSVNNSICINRFHMCIGSTHRHIGAKFNGTRWHMLVVVVVGACNWSHQTNWRGQTVGQVGRCLQYVFRYLLHACESKNSAESTASCLSLFISLTLSVSHSHEEIDFVAVSATVLYLIKCNQQRYEWVCTPVQSTNIHILVCKFDLAAVAAVNITERMTQV